MSSNGSWLPVYSCLPRSSSSYRWDSRRQQEKERNCHMNKQNALKKFLKKMEWKFPGNVRCFLPLKTSCSSEKIKRKNNTRGGRRENSTVIFAVALCWGIILHEKDHNIMQIKDKTICLIQYSVIYRIYERERAVITFWVVSLVLYKRNNTEKGIFAKTERQLFGGPASLSTALAIVTSSDAKTK